MDTIIIIIFADEEAEHGEAEPHIYIHIHTYDHKWISQTRSSVKSKLKK